MPIKSHLGIRPAHLCPDGLRIAAGAYDAALHSVQENDDFGADTARKLLARYIIERALGGDRDLEGMRKGALECLRGQQQGPTPRRKARAA